MNHKKSSDLSALTDADIDALLFSLLEDDAADTSNIMPPTTVTQAETARATDKVDISRWRQPRRLVGITVAAAAIAAVSFSTAWFGGLLPATRDPDVQLAAEPVTVSASDFNPQLLSSVAKGTDYSGLVEPAAAETCVAVNVNKLNENSPENVPLSNIYSQQISALELVLGAAPVTFGGSARQLFVLRLPGEGTTSALWALVTNSECGQVGASGKPEAATVHVAALS